MLAVSHPAHAARRMLDHKRISHRPIYLLPGFHPALLRVAGFAGPTVPALELDGRKVQGSRAISRALDAFRVEPRLFPEEAGQRAAVQEAERWGEEELQDVPRRLFRWATARQRPVRRWLGELAGIPAPGLIGELNAPLARRFADRSGADDERIAKDLHELPPVLDRVDRLIESGTIGSASPNAADLQIGSSLRLLMAFEQLRPVVEGRAGGALALRLFPRFPEPIPAELPVRSEG
jgi:glutathione S-transferase